MLTDIRWWSEGTVRQTTDRPLDISDAESDNQREVVFADSRIDDEVVLFRATEVARILGVSRSKVYQMMSEGALPVIRIGRAVRVPKRALAEWVKENTIRAA